MKTIEVRTSQRSEMIDITTQVAAAVRQLGVSAGEVAVFCPHTTAAVTINEAADPAVAADVLEALERLVPWDAGWRHTEGNAAAHVKSVLVGCSVRLGVAGGRLALGQWQGIFFCEFDGPRRRRVQVRATPGGPGSGQEGKS